MKIANLFPQLEQPAKRETDKVSKMFTHLYFLPSALMTLRMGIKFRLGVFLKVGEGDVRVPPVGHSVVEDPVEGGQVGRGGEGGAPVVVARCLSPNDRPHLVGIARSQS